MGGRGLSCGRERPFPAASGVEWEPGAPFSWKGGAGRARATAACFVIAHRTSPTPTPLDPAAQALFLWMHAAKDPGATVVALIVSVSTLIKTVLYFMITFNGTATNIVRSAVCVTSWATASWADCQEFVGFYVLTNGWWILIPALVVYSTGSQLARANAKLRSVVASRP